AHADAQVEVVAGARRAGVAEPDQHGFLFQRAELPRRQRFEIAFRVADVVVLADASGECSDAIVPLRELQPHAEAQTWIEAVVVAPQSAGRYGTVGRAILVVAELIAEQAVEPRG